MAKVYAYGVRIHPDSLSLIESELRKAHRYHNALIEAHRRAFEARQSRRQQEPEQAKLEQKILAVVGEIQAVREEAKAARVKARKRIANPAAKAKIKKLEERKKKLRAEQKKLRAKIKSRNEAAYKELRSRVDRKMAELGKTGPTIRGEVKRSVIPEMVEETRWPDCWRDEQRITFKLEEECRQLRGQAGLLSGTYKAVEDAVAASVKDNRKRGKPPRFRRWDGTGRVGCQLHQHTVSATHWAGWPDELRQSYPAGKLTDLHQQIEEVAESRHLLLQPLPEGTWGTRSGRRHARSEAALRVNSERGHPVWAYLFVNQHRPLPDDAQLTWAYLVVKRVGNRYRHELQITLDTDQAPRRGQGRVAVDVGWRTMRDGSVRAGMAVGDDGARTEIRVPAAVIEKLNHAHSLKSIGDRCFDLAKPVFAAWARENPELLPDWFERFVKVEKLEDGSRPKLPREEWVPKFLASLPVWKSRPKLARLIHDWSREVLGGDEYVHQLWDQWRTCKPPDLWPTLEGAAEFLGTQTSDVRALALWLDWWRRKDGHLYQWERDVEKRALLHRREVFRIAARRLADRYGEVILEDFRLTPFCVKPKPENLVLEGDDGKRAKRVQTAPASLRDAVELAFHGHSERRPCKFTTVVCHACLKLCEWDAGKYLEHTCEHCGKHWDQDVNAGINLLSEKFFDTWHPPEEEEAQAAE